MAQIDDIDIPKLIFPEAAAPATPAAGKVIIYSKADGLMYQKDDAGTETQMGPGSGGIPATIFDAKGDIIAATAADTAARLAAGANGAILQTLSTETTGLIWTPALVAAQAQITSATTIPATSTWTDITGATVTLTTGAHRCRVSASVVRVFQTGTSHTTKIRVDVDGTPIDVLGEALVKNNVPSVTAQYDVNMMISGLLTGVLTAASHTIKLQGWSDAAASVLGSATTTIGYLTVEETLLTI